MKIHITNFVRRQTEDSHFSHWTISDEDLVARIHVSLLSGGRQTNVRSYRHTKVHQGYREGVLLVPIEPEGFFCAVETLRPGNSLMGSYQARKEGEDPRKEFWIEGKKTRAMTVWVVLYAKHVLAEKNENESDADYEIVSVNSSPTLDDNPPPMSPETLIANHFELSGGTATNMTDGEFVGALRESVMYWKDKIQVRG